MSKRHSCSQDEAPFGWPFDRSRSPAARSAFASARCAKEWRAMSCTQATNVCAGSDKRRGTF